MVDIKTTKGREKLSIVELGKLSMPIYGAMDDQFQRQLKQANTDFRKKILSSRGISLLGASVDKISFAVIMNIFMAYKILTKETEVPLSPVLFRLSKFYNRRDWFSSGKAEYHRARIIDSYYYGKQSHSITPDVESILHGLSILTAFLSIAVSSYHLKRSIDKKIEIAELKSVICKSMQKFLENIQIPGLDKDIGLDYIRKITLDDTRRQIKSYISRSKQQSSTQYSIEELAVLIGKLNPLDVNDQVYLQYVHQDLQDKINTSSNPKQTSQVVGDIIAISAMVMAQQHIERANTLENIAVALKILGLALAVAGLVVACLVTTGVAPAIMGSVSGIIGVCLGLGLGRLDHDIDISVPASRDYLTYAKEIKSKVETGSPGQDRLTTYYSEKYRRDSSLNIVPRSHAVFDKFTP